MKVLCAAFLCLHSGFEIFWQKNIGAKVAHKMLMKLNTGVNFINPLAKSANAPALVFCLANSVSPTKPCPTSSPVTLNLGWQPTQQP